MLFNLFSDSAMLSWARTLRLRPSFVRLYSSVLPTKPVPCSRTATLASEHVAAHVSRDIAAVNSRLQNLQLTASYLSSGQPLLGETVFFYIHPSWSLFPAFFFPSFLFTFFSFSCSFSARRSSSFFPILCAISLLRFCFLLPFCTLPPSMLLSLYTFLLPVLQQSPFHAICRCSAHMQCC
jgi:hypothetical protein